MPRGREPAAVTGAVEPRHESPFSASEVQFLLDAIACYCTTHCPLDREQAGCPLLTWHESVHSGAIERACAAPYEFWRSRLTALAAAG